LIWKIYVIQHLPYCWKDLKSAGGGVSSEFRKYNHPHAIFYTHGVGSHIYDVDGNDYLDFTLSQGPLILGQFSSESIRSSG
jgi:glutamate-1-semialdehyde 2,1-aminomutase